MKATMRQGGERMFTFRVEHIVGLFGLSAIVAQWASENEGEPLPATRSAVLVLARNFFERQGDVNDATLDDVATEQFDAAQACVLALFPELDSTRTARAS